MSEERKDRLNVSKVIIPTANVSDDGFVFVHHSALNCDNMIVFDLICNIWSRESIWFDITDIS